MRQKIRAELEECLRAGLTNSEIARRMHRPDAWVARHLAELQESVSREETGEALAQSSPAPTASDLARRADLVAAAQITPADIARATRGQLVLVQRRVLEIIDAASLALSHAVASEDAHAAQQYAVVLGISLDQSHKILREVRDLAAEAQDDIETGWIVVVREDEAPDGA